MRFNVACPYGAPAPRERVQPEEGGTLQGWGTSACSHEGGTVAVARAPCLCPCSARRTTADQADRGGARASVLRGRLQSVDPTIERSSTRARPKSRLRAAPALAPPGAHTAGEPAAALLPVERESGRATRKKLRQRRSAYAFARSSLRYFRGSPPHPPTSLEKGVQIPGYSYRVHAPARGEGVR